MENKQLDIENIINNLSFVFAKTMPHNPHYYTVRTKDNEDFYCELFRYIQNNGYFKKWYNGVEYKYCVIGDYLYWIMTDDIEESKIINRINKV